MSEQRGDSLPAALIYFDRDSHGEGCSCGLCNSNGIAIGVGIYDVSSLPSNLFEEGYEDDLNDEIRNTLDVEHVCYGPDEQVAYENARTWAREAGYQMVVE